MPREPSRYKEKFAVCTEHVPERLEGAPKRVISLSMEVPLRNVFPGKRVFLPSFTPIEGHGVNVVEAYTYQE